MILYHICSQKQLSISILVSRLKYPEAIEKFSAFLWDMIYVHMCMHVQL